LDSEEKKEIKQGSEDSITTCAWFPDNEKFVCAGKQGQFYMTDLSGQALEQWEGIRVYGIHHFNDMKFLASDSRNRIRCYDWGEMIDTSAVEENTPILSFSLSKDGNYALLNLKQQGLHLWDTKCNSLVRRYRGNKQDLYLIYSCFGGTGSEYLATGSEDNQIYIFHRDKETPISKLYGHTKSVSCVDWHPSLSGFVVSCSDDFTVKLWKPTTSGDSSDESDSPDDVSSDSLD
jgi:WD40 repeat protein